jgi:type II secretory pathway pseudopilin PulG
MKKGGTPATIRSALDPDNTPWFKGKTPSPGKVARVLGFTIVETLIFLAVSGIIFVSAIRLLSGKQNSTEFSTGLGTFTSQLQNAVNNVSTGYYNLPDTTACQAQNSGSAATIRLSTASNSVTGQNFGCTFIGDALHFCTDTSCNQAQYQVYPLIGLQYKGNVPPIQSTSLADAHPTSAADLANSLAMPYGLTVDYIHYVNSSPPTTESGQTILFFTTFNTYAPGTSQLNSGSQNVEIAPMPTPASPTASLVSQINSITDDCAITGDICEGQAPTDPSAPKNPPAGVEVCINSGSTSNSALLTIGGDTSGSFITTQIFTNQGCT